jgi:hypothetical protein
MTSGDYEVVVQKRDEKDEFSGHQGIQPAQFLVLRTLIETNLLGAPRP